MERSGSFAHVEEPEATLQILREFLARSTSPTASL